MIRDGLFRVQEGSSARFNASESAVTKFEKAWLSETFKLFEAMSEVIAAVLDAVADR